MWAGARAHLGPGCEGVPGGLCKLGQSGLPPAAKAGGVELQVSWVKALMCCFVHSKASLWATAWHLCVCKGSRLFGVRVRKKLHFQLHFQLKAMPMSSDISLIVVERNDNSALPLLWQLGCFILLSHESMCPWMFHFNTIHPRCASFCMHKFKV